MHKWLTDLQLELYKYNQTVCMYKCCPKKAEEEATKSGIENVEMLHVYVHTFLVCFFF